ncbi:MAG: hypothetical protein EOO53_14340 [Gammaproteobacteria bacterium]|nr:MAG: hypothetical protein EOO53_14340 [Gammaproteobacteria bacterium]
MTETIPSQEKPKKIKKLQTKNPNKESENSTTAENINLDKIADLVELIRTNDDELIKTEVQKHLIKIKSKYNLEQYITLILYDNCDSISTFHANSIYNEASTNAKQKNIYLLLHSGGGKIEPAYLISKTCKSLTQEKFIVAVPRRAKSAATLISLGADEIHMGLMSELGPIDPQIGGYPALGLANALNKLAELSSKFPQSSDMFASYLTKNLNLRDLGYFERVSESASQYGERLLRGKQLPAPNTPESLADHFVNHYKDHGFVIDIDEARKLLGNNIIKSDTQEYQCANEVYSFLNFFEFALDRLVSKEFYYVGSFENGLSLRAKTEK